MLTTWLYQIITKICPCSSSSANYQCQQQQQQQLFASTTKNPSALRTGLFFNKGKGGR